MFVRDFAVSVAVGTILLLSLSRLVGRVQFSLSTAFWCSLIGHSFVSVISLLAGFFFAHQLQIGLFVALAIGCVFLTFLLQIAVRARTAFLRAGECSFFL
jgi:hypothetical protein